MIVKNVFHGRQFVLDLPTSVSYREKQLLKSKITTNNGIVSYIITRKTNYLIRDASDKSQTYRSRIAAKYGVPAVKLEFVDACLKKGRLLKSKLYAAQDEYNQQQNQFAIGKVMPNTEEKSKNSFIRLHQVKSWPYKDKDGPKFHNFPYIVLKAALLKGEQSQKGHSFCIIEAHFIQNENYLKAAEYKFCVFTHQGILPSSTDVKDYGTKKCRFLETSSETLQVFEHLHKLYTNPPYSMSQHVSFPRYAGLGSDSFHVNEWSLPSVLVEPKVAQFVAEIWAEAVYVLESALSVPLKSIQANQISTAEGLLLEISNALLVKDTKKVQALSNEFYCAIPHHYQNSIINRRLLTREHNLCQLTKDMVALQELVSLSDQKKIEQQYFSMHCDIQVLKKRSPEYKELISLILNTKEDLNFTINRVFKVHRSCESDDFAYNIGNKKLLFHGSKVENFVGILSRGLLLCNDVCSQDPTTEYDNVLGTGLYFTDELTTMVKFTAASKTSGQRLFLVSEVALGKCYMTFSHNRQLVQPPDGYNSVCGVKCCEPDTLSHFDHNEYVVYEINQQRLKYVVEFYLPEDVPSFDKIATNVDCSIAEVIPSTIFTDTRNSEKMVNTPTFDVQHLLNKYGHEVIPRVVGLQSQASIPIPLKSVHVRAKLIDFAAEVVIMQEYHNDSSTSIEARYMFPLNEKAAVCGFEAFSNGQHFIGRVEEKQEARMEYREAVDSGKRAYLMDEQAPDVFRVSVGNVQPNSTVLIKIRYVAELDLEGDLISFHLPGTVSPWQQQQAFGSQLQVDVDTVDALYSQNIDTSLQIFVEMPFDIKTLFVQTHRMQVKKTLSKAVLTSDGNINLSKNFQLLIGLTEIHVPRMWVEKHPEMDSSACMLTFYPEFVSDVKGQIEIILALDASSSMAGTPFVAVQQIALLCLHYMPLEAKFNILLFGSIYCELFPAPQKKSLETIHIGEQYILQSQPTLGSSRIDHFLVSYYKLIPDKGTLRNIFIITDGYLQHVDRVLSSASKDISCIRLFSFGVGEFANSHNLQRLSHSGGGAYQQFNERKKSQWAQMVKAQMQKAEEPVLTGVRVEWQQFNAGDKVLQAPRQLNAIFSGSRLIVYGFAPNCNLATLHGSVNGNDISTTVFTSELAESTGTILHCLATKAAVSDWQHGVLNGNRVLHEVQKRSLKKKIIKLSKQFSIISGLTSFVCIEDKDSEEIQGFNTHPSVSEFVAAEQVDFLEYVQSQLSHNVEKMRKKDLTGVSLDKCANHELDSLVGNYFVVQAAQDDSSSSDDLLCGHESNEELSDSNDYCCVIDESAPPTFQQPAFLATNIRSKPSSGNFGSTNAALTSASLTSASQTTATDPSLNGFGFTKNAHAHSFTKDVPPLNNFSFGSNSFGPNNAMPAQLITSLSMEPPSNGVSFGSNNSCFAQMELCQEPLLSFSSYPSSNAQTSGFGSIIPANTAPVMTSLDNPLFYHVGSTLQSDANASLHYSTGNYPSSPASNCNVGFGCGEMQTQVLPTTSVIRKDPRVESEYSNLLGLSQVNLSNTAPLTSAQSGLFGSKSVGFDVAHSNFPGSSQVCLSSTAKPAVSQSSLFGSKSAGFGAAHSDFPGSSQVRLSSKATPAVLQSGPLFGSNSSRFGSSIPIQRTTQPTGLTFGFKPDEKPTQLFPSATFIRKEQSADSERSSTCPNFARSSQAAVVSNTATPAVSQSGPLFGSNSSQFGSSMPIQRTTQPTGFTFGFKPDEKPTQPFPSAAVSQKDQVADSERSSTCPNFAGSSEAAVVSNTATPAVSQSGPLFGSNSSQFGSSMPIQRTTQPTGFTFGFKPDEKPTQPFPSAAVIQIDQVADSERSSTCSNFAGSSQAAVVSNTAKPPVSQTGPLFGSNSSQFGSSMPIQRTTQPTGFTLGFKPDEKPTQPFPSAAVSQKDHVADSERSSTHSNFAGSSQAAVVSNTAKPPVSQSGSLFGSNSSGFGSCIPIQRTTQPTGLTLGFKPDEKQTQPFPSAAVIQKEQGADSERSSTHSNFAGSSQAAVVSNTAKPPVSQTGSLFGSNSSGFGSCIPIQRTTQPTGLTLGFKPDEKQTQPFPSAAVIQKEQGADSERSATHSNFAGSSQAAVVSNTAKPAVSQTGSLFGSNSSGFGSCIPIQRTTQPTGLTSGFKPDEKQTQPFPSAAVIQKEQGADSERSSTHSNFARSSQAAVVSNTAKPAVSQTGSLFGSNSSGFGSCIPIQRTTQPTGLTSGFKPDEKQTQPFPSAAVIQKEQGADSERSSTHSNFAGSSQAAVVSNTAKPAVSQTGSLFGSNSSGFGSCIPIQRTTQPTGFTFGFKPDKKPTQLLPNTTVIQKDQVDNSERSSTCSNFAGASQAPIVSNTAKPAVSQSGSLFGSNSSRVGSSIIPTQCAAPSTGFSFGFKLDGKESLVLPTASVNKKVQVDNSERSSTCSNFAVSSQAAVVSNTAKPAVSQTGSLFGSNSSGFGSCIPIQRTTQPTGLTSGFKPDEKQTQPFPSAAVIQKDQVADSERSSTHSNFAGSSQAAVVSNTAKPAVSQTGSLFGSNSSGFGSCIPIQRTTQPTGLTSGFKPDEKQTQPFPSAAVIQKEQVADSERSSTHSNFAGSSQAAVVSNTAKPAVSQAGFLFGSNSSGFGSCIPIQRTTQPTGLTSGFKPDEKQTQPFPSAAVIQKDQVADSERSSTHSNFAGSSEAAVVSNTAKPAVSQTGSLFGSNSSGFGSCIPIQRTTQPTGFTFGFKPDKKPTQLLPNTTVIQKDQVDNSERSSTCSNFAGASQAPIVSNTAKPAVSQSGSLFGSNSSRVGSSIIPTQCAAPSTGFSFGFKLDGKESLVLPTASVNKKVQVDNSERSSTCSNFAVSSQAEVVSNTAKPAVLQNDSLLGSKSFRFGSSIPTQCAAASTGFNFGFKLDGKESLVLPTASVNQKDQVGNSEHPPTCSNFSVSSQLCHSNIATPELAQSGSLFDVKPSGFGSTAVPPQRLLAPTNFKFGFRTNEKQTRMLPTASIIQKDLIAESQNSPAHVNSPVSSQVCLSNITIPAYAANASLFGSSSFRFGSSTVSTLCPNAPTSFKFGLKANEKPNRLFPTATVVQKDQLTDSECLPTHSKLLGLPKESLSTISAPTVASSLDQFGCSPILSKLATAVKSQAPLFVADMCSPHLYAGVNSYKSLKRQLALPDHCRVGGLPPNMQSSVRLKRFYYGNSTPTTWNLGRGFTVSQYSTNGNDASPVTDGRHHDAGSSPQNEQQQHRRQQQQQQQQQHQQQEKQTLQQLPNEGSMCLGSGLPFFSALLKKLASSNFAFMNSQQMLSTINERLSKLPESSTDTKTVRALDCCNLKGAVQQTSLFSNWNHELWSEIKSKLISSGLKSMGNIVHEAILDLIATTAVLWAVYRELCPTSFPLNVSSLDVITVQVRDMADSCNTCVSERGRLSVLRSLVYLTTVNQRYPMVYRTLELGNSWEEAFYNLTNGTQVFSVE